MTLGKRLKNFAEKNYSSFTEFSKELGIGRENLYRYFNDTVSPGVKYCKAAAMGCDINWLLWLIPPDKTT
jgi:transcriptional regulator with XRE-family HTH domain